MCRRRGHLPALGGFPARQDSSFLRALPFSRFCPPSFLSGAMGRWERSFVQLTGADSLIKLSLDEVAGAGGLQLHASPHCLCASQATPGPVNDLPCALCGDANKTEQCPGPPLIIHAHPCRASRGTKGRSCQDTYRFQG